MLASIKDDLQDFKLNEGRVQENNEVPEDTDELILKHNDKLGANLIDFMMAEKVNKMLPI